MDYLPTRLDQLLAALHHNYVIRLLNLSLRSENYFFKYCLTSYKHVANQVGNTQEHQLEDVRLCLLEQSSIFTTCILSPLTSCHSLA